MKKHNLNRAEIQAKLDTLSPRNQIKWIVSNCPDTCIKMIQIRQNLYDYVIANTPLLNNPHYTFQTRVYWIANDLVDFPKCQYHGCGKPLINVNVKTCCKGYRTRFCNSSCANLSKQTQQKKELTTLERHGSRYISQTSMFKEKVEKTNLRNHGVKWYTNPEKRKQTNLKLRGVECPFASKEVQNKCEERFIEVYGVRRPAQNESINAKCRTQFVYEQMNFRSSWELAYYIWLKDHQIQFEFQPKGRRIKYYVDCKEHYYFPDFYLVESKTLVEIKGDHFIDQDNHTMINVFAKDDIQAQKLIQAKFECMKANNVRIMTSDELEPILRYCVSKFGYQKWYQRFRSSKTIL